MEKVYRQASGPTVDTNRERDVAGKSIIFDRDRPGEDGIADPEAPGTSTDGDAGVEEFVAADGVARHCHTGITTLVYVDVVDQVDCAESRFGG